MDHSNVSSLTAPVDECSLGEGSPTRILSGPHEMKIGPNYLKVSRQLSEKIEGVNFKMMTQPSSKDEDDVHNITNILTFAC